MSDAYIASDQIERPDRWIIDSPVNHAALTLIFDQSDTVYGISTLGNRRLKEPAWYCLVPHDRVLALLDWLGERCEALATAAQDCAVSLLKFQGDTHEAARISEEIGRLGHRIAVLRQHRSDLERDLPF